MKRKIKLLALFIPALLLGSCKDVRYYVDDNYKEIYKLEENNKISIKKIDYVDTYTQDNELYKSYLVYAVIDEMEWRYHTIYYFVIHYKEGKIVGNTYKAIAKATEYLG